MSDQKFSSENNIDQIRELIFGPTMRDYERRFEAIQKQIQDLKADLEKKFNELGDSLKAGGAATKENFQKIDARLEQAQKENKQALQSLEAELVEKINLLQNDKTDRLQLANFLTEIALRLKGDNVMQQLSEQIDPSK